MSDTRSLFDARQAALDKSDCGNGPDEYGNYPCDPKVLFGGGFAECRVCGRVAPWSETEMRETDD
jgi:hypothetical protein